MRRKGVRRKRGARGALLFLLILVIAGACFVPWALQPESLRLQKDQLQGFLFRTSHQEAYQMEALLLTDCSSGEDFLAKSAEEPQLPASLAKLFVIEYAATLADLETVVPVSQAALDLVPPGSSMAWIGAGEYSLQNLFAAMLVPSGNDAAYAVADYCGGLLNPQAAPGQGRIDVFLEGLNRYLAEQGYTGTALYDPSGFDQEARTTAADLSAVTQKLLDYPWFRDMVSQSSYTATLPDGTTWTWENTNQFLDPESPYYNGNVRGVKTGSFGDSYNLMVLYQQHGKEFLICCLGAESDEARYQEAAKLLAVIDESSYLSW